MYKRIVVPVVFDDGAEAKTKAALAVARHLADADATVTVLHVLEQVPGYVATYLPPDFVAKARDTLEGRLSALAATLDNAKAVLVDGHAGRTILDWAHDNESDLIVIASHHPGMQDLIIGSTAAHVVRHAQCAVHVLR